MPRRPYLPVLVLTLLSACGPDNRSAPADPAASPQAAMAEPAASSTTPGIDDPAAATPAADPGRARPTPEPIAAVTGVAECDRFLDRYRRCLARLPEEMRPGIETALQAWEGSWRTMSANPASQGNLAAMCSRTADNAWAAVARFNCPR